MVPDTVHSAVGHVIVDAAFVVVAVLNIDDVVKETSKVDLRFLVIEVEWGWVVGWVVVWWWVGGVQKLCWVVVSFVR